MEVTRSETCMCLPSISALGGNVVMRPSQEPAKVFSLSKDFCASDCAKAVAASRTNRTESAIRDFMFGSPFLFLDHLEIFLGTGFNKSSQSWKVLVTPNFRSSYKRL